MALNDLQFIRLLIDLIDSRKEQEPAAATAPVIINIGKNGDVSSSCDSTETETESPIDGTDVFIPPLQAKIEMMKKMTGVEVKNQDLLSSDDDEPFDG